jgi:hypothetical protein
MSNDTAVSHIADTCSAANKRDRDHAVDELDCALDAEVKARAALIAIGEEWKKLLENSIDPSKEEHALHAHLIREWQRAAGVVAQILQQPLR